MQRCPTRHRHGTRRLGRFFFVQRKWRQWRRRNDQQLIVVHVVQLEQQLVFFRRSDWFQQQLVLVFVQFEQQQ